MAERIERLELENQRLREIISDKSDHEAELQRRVAEMGAVLWRR